MKETISLYDQNFKSSCTLTPQFALFYKTFSREFRQLLKKAGAKEIKISRRHFYISGFFTSSEDNIYYFSILDVRFWKRNELLIRRADSFTDYSGGQNNYLPFDSDLQYAIELFCGS